MDDSVPLPCRLVCRIFVCLFVWWGGVEGGSSLIIEWSVCVCVYVVFDGLERIFINCERVRGCWDLCVIRQSKGIAMATDRSVDRRQRRDFAPECCPFAFSVGDFVKGSGRAGIG